MPNGDGNGKMPAWLPNRVVEIAIVVAGLGGTLYTTQSVVLERIDNVQTDVAELRKEVREHDQVIATVQTLRAEIDLTQRWNEDKINQFQRQLDEIQEKVEEHSHQ